MKWAWESATIFDLQNWHRFIREEVLKHLSFSDFVVYIQKEKNYCQFKHNFLLAFELVCIARQHFHHHQFER